MIPKILIVDDDRLSVTLLKVTFKEHHYEVLTASDGQEGLEVVRAGKPELIILDIQMPNMSGFEFMGELKTIPGGAAIPVIMLTVNDNMQNF